MTSVEPKYPTIDSIVAAAKANLAPELWDYLSGGAETETTLRRNRAAFDRVAFRPRRLRDVRRRDPSTTFLGKDIDLPVMIAPIGSIANYDAEGALACARVAEALGTAVFVSCLASPSIKEISEQTQCPTIYQIYVLGDRSTVLDQIRAAENCGCVGICLTVDLAARGRRERNLVNRFGVAGGGKEPDTLERLLRASEILTWDDVTWFKSQTNLPLIVKGIMCGEDAELAIEHGVDVIYLSNHGGRQLDHLPATIDLLPEIARTVGGRAELIVDSGFVRGADVVKAKCLGASAVLIGKLAAWGLAAGGVAGLERALRLVREEITDLMAHLGVRELDELSTDYVIPTYPPGDYGWIGTSFGEFAANSGVIRPGEPQED